MISNINFVKNELGQLKAKKHLGQNFIIDQNIVEKIAKNACKKELTTIEIGPGLGALTEELIKYSKKVIAYEIDNDMYDLLKKNINNNNLVIVLEDFLNVDLSKYKEKINICSNLPYYITTPILFKIFESELDINKITVMVQKEVGDRLCAKVGSEDYGALSIEVQYLYKVNLEMKVSKNVFYPQPNVDSSVISFIPTRERNIEFENKFFSLVKKCFRMRRKTLANNLKDVFCNETIDKIYTKMNLEKNIRAEQMSLNDYMKMFEIIYER